MVNTDLNVQGCDATGDDSSAGAGYKKSGKERLQFFPHRLRHYRFASCCRIEKIQHNAARTQKLSMFIVNILEKFYPVLIGQFT